ncbi:precorrin-6Y C5,15-methyltransferase (decarboxylating) subunit CbiT [Candidatus Formimonas warabiya]|uniref:Precorrin-6Y C5,15-methyltransferase (Decarboxylating) subunit CbiT n=1 Tax=Formimonas warabiya TaxID=1761012 RepID=A0A3G1L0E3_FORW1|nr:precorrin-6Y C5,15-methyltransferase (decarboxylating) subunit CbiT [Candidatus Formimonas warabiya]ATW28127.1 precorrin-6Y C5,15-methyltransferase (decarboxylating) subunit CbiT [Candidatus Formimonas warabiya]
MAWNYSTPGIPEHYFKRGKVPLTKTEVRVIALAKMRLQPDSLVLDVGCGTGSITVEAALHCPKGRVWAVDMDEEAVQLSRENAEKFDLSNVEIIQGPAPECLPDLNFDRIFIGGASNQLEEVVRYAKEHLAVNGILVANTILLDSTYKILKLLEEHGFKEMECICVNISRGEKHSGWMMKALNPIYIISAVKSTEQREV